MTRHRGRRRSRAGLAAALVAILAFGCSTSDNNWETRSIIGVTGNADSATLEVTVSHEDCGTGDPRVTFEEASDTVQLHAEYDLGELDCSDVGLESTVRVELDQNLGDRQLHVLSGEGVECDIEGHDFDRCLRVLTPS